METVWKHPISEHVHRRSSLSSKVGDRAKLKKVDSKDSKEANGKPKASVGSPVKGPVASGHGKDAMSIDLSGPKKDEKRSVRSPKNGKQKVSDLEIPHWCPCGKETLKHHEKYLLMCSL